MRSKKSIDGVNRTAAFARLLALLLLSIFPFVEAEEQKVSALRSAYLFYFSSFIEWPDLTEFRQKNVLLCAFTESENDQFQLNTIKGKALGELKLDIRILDLTQKDEEDQNISSLAGNSEAISDCHLLYVNESASVQFPGIPDTTLVITEGDVASRGDIHLFKKSNKLMFEIDASRLNSRHFKVSSKLLRLSRKEQN